MGSTSSAKRRRADAQRSIDALTDAGLECFLADPDASMSAVAKAAGVSRVTLYTHFASRAELFEAVLALSVEKADEILGRDAPDEGPACEAFDRLLRRSWRILERHSALMVAGGRLLTPERQRFHHEKMLGRVERLLARGRDEGVFRTDVPLHWLTTVVYQLLHGAAGETEAGYLTAEEVPQVLLATLRSALAPAPPPDGSAPPA